MSSKDLGGPYTVVSRSHTERLVKNEKISKWSVTLHNEDGHAHSITSKNPELWQQYPFGEDVELSLGKEKQTKLAVQQVRDMEDKTEDEVEEEKKWNP
jgi:hypothetical protein